MSDQNPFRLLPENCQSADLDDQVHALLEGIQNRVPDAINRVGPLFGDLSGNKHDGSAVIELADAQLILAREYGYSSWVSLKAKLSAQLKETPAASDPIAKLDTEQLANHFLDLAIVHYTYVPDIGPTRFARAKALLDKYPSISKTSIYTAAAAGDVDAVGEWLAKSPKHVNQKGGYFNWEPLMYASYARVPEHSTLNAAQVLLEHGADPNVFYMSFGQYKFTALTGAFGGGEGGLINQPPHPDYQTLCTKLLLKGANPNDSQAAYNRCFEPDNTCFKMLINHGLNAKDTNNWLVREDDKLVPQARETMLFHMIHSIKNSFFDRVKLLVEAGTDLERTDEFYDTRTKGKTPLETALIMGEQEIADYLISQGAKTNRISSTTRLLNALSLADEAKTRAILQEEPELIKELAPQHREILCDAIKRKRFKALDIMIKLGFTLNDNSDRTPLHEAALDGDVNILKKLIEAGADSSLREPTYCQPPLGFAIHVNQQAAIEYLDTQAMDIFTAAVRGNLNQLKSHIETEPASVNQHFDTVRPPLKNALSHENDWMTPLIYALSGNKHDAVKLLLDNGADINIKNNQGNGVLEIAQECGCDSAILSLLKKITAS